MVTETELLNFLMAYYPQLKFVLSYGRHGTLYILLDRRNSNQILSKVNFDEFEKYLKDKLNFNRILLKYDKDTILDKYLHLVLGLVDYENLITKKIELYQDDNLINEFETKTKMQDWILNTTNFNLGNLMPYICPKCKELENTKLIKGNAIIYKCIFCKHEVVEVL